MLKLWSSTKFGTGTKLTNTLKARPISIQESMQNNVDDDSMAGLECEVSKQYTKALLKENEMIKQKARLRWKVEGDRNTSYFHAALKAKQTHENICSISDENGKLHQDTKNIATTFINYYSNLFGNAENTFPDTDAVNPMLLPKLSQEDVQFF